jgi:hypothetical protein
MIFARRYKNYIERRDRLLHGSNNCIVSPFTRGREGFVGIQQGKYYLVTGNTKSAKTSLTNHLFLLNPLMQAYGNRSFRLKIFYYSLEMSVSQLFDKFTCYWLFLKTGGRVSLSPMDLNSVTKPLSREALSLLRSREANAFFSFVEDTVVFHEDVHDAGEIFKRCRGYALSHGMVKTRVTGTGEEFFDRYEPSDPDEYRLLIVDHYGLLARGGRSLRETIQEFSSRDCVMLRNHYGFTVVGVMQQNAAKQGNDSFRLDRLSPSVDGLAENKSTAQDVDMMLGIFSPWYFEKTEWHGYNIKAWRDRIRFLEVILNREGVAGSIIPLYFNGAVGYFKELPLPSNQKLKDYEKKLL